MATILEFRSAVRLSDPAAIPQGQAEVLLFPGVRYERVVTEAQERERGLHRPCKGKRDQLELDD